MLLFFNTQHCIKTTYFQFNMYENKSQNQIIYCLYNFALYCLYKWFVREIQGCFFIYIKLFLPMCVIEWIMKELPQHVENFEKMQVMLTILELLLASLF